MSTGAGVVEKSFGLYTFARTRPELLFRGIVTFFSKIYGKLSASSLLMSLTSLGILAVLQEELLLRMPLAVAG